MTIENVKCPDCGGDMVSRKSSYGVFWGCKSYPKCRGTRDSMGESKQDKLKEKDDTSESNLPSSSQSDNDKYRFRKC